MPISTKQIIILDKFAVPTEGILHSEENVTCFKNSNESIGSGKLFVTERSVLWLNNEEMGFHLNYQKINIHAISRNINSFPSPCIYVMMEAEPTECVEVANDEDDDVDDDDDAITEIRFVPANPLSLDDIYNAMSKGNALNPDPNDSNSAEEDDDYEAYEGGEGDGGPDISNGNGNADIHENETVEEGQFDDDDDNMQT